MLAVSNGWASAQSSQDLAYGKIVKEIRLPELRWTKEHVILRELASKVGEVYTQENAKKDLVRLDRLDLFSSFDIRAITEGDEVILEIECEETHPFIMFPALSSTDENGVAIGPGVRTLNLRGLGVTFGGTAKFGGVTAVGHSDPREISEHRESHADRAGRRRGRRAGAKARESAPLHPETLDRRGAG